jgi:hypothetical membrane protein
MAITVKPLNSIPETAFRVVLAAGTLFLVLLATLLVLKPEIDPAWRFISEYAIGRHGWLMSIAFLSLAACCVATVIALWSQLRVGGRIGAGFLLIGALGLTLAGIFTTDPITTPLDRRAASCWTGRSSGDGGTETIIIVPIRNKAW